MKPTGLVWEMTRCEVEAVLASVGAVIIPTGSLEQHGTHLPMGHDTASAVFVAAKTAERLYPRVLVTPPLPVGLSPHHMRWPLSLTLKPATFIAVLLDLANSLKQHGVTSVVILNGHGGNRRVWEEIGGSATEIAAGKMREMGLKAAAVDYWELLPQSFLKETLDVEPSGGHAGEFETSVALFMFPEMVKSERARCEGTSLGAEAATAEKGKRLLERIVDELVACLNGLLAQA